jgi:Ca2+/Na+ antiporter
MGFTGNSNNVRKSTGNHFFQTQQMKTFKSKISIPLLIVICITLAGSCIAMASVQEWYSLAALLLLSLFILYSFASIRYRINDGKLLITIGFFYKKQIDINTISKIVKTNNPLSAPAASLDRLEIFYNHHQSILISPEQKEEFVKQLQQLNPEIEVN